MGKNIKGLAGSTIFNQKMVEQMNGINKNNKGKASFVEDNCSGNREKYLLLDYKVQVKFAGIWITVKSLHDEDEEYAKNCANELLEKLNEKI